MSSLVISKCTKCNMEYESDKPVICPCEKVASITVTGSSSVYCECEDKCSKCGKERKKEWVYVYPQPTYYYPYSGGTTYTPDTWCGTSTTTADYSTSYLLH